MKRILFSLLCLSALFAFADIAPGGNASPLAANEAYVILNGLPLYQESGSTLAWKENLVIGDKVVITGRVYKFKVSGNEREYIKVKAPSGNEGWVRTAYVVQKASLAVVKLDKAVVYSEPRDVKITSKAISPMTIVAVLQDGSTGEFAKVVCYDQKQDAYYTDPVFVSRSDLSYSDTDVNAMILYMTAAATKNQDIRSNLFLVIQKRYAGSMFFDKIRSVLSPASASAALPVVAASGNFVCNDNNVNVRATPDADAGAVTSQLAKGDQVQVVEATAQTYTVGGKTAVWYHLKSPDGWVFGAFLDQAAQ